MAKQSPHIVDLVKLQDHLEDRADPIAYAPPAAREADADAKKESLPDLAVKVIRTFGSLPTTELDDMVTALKSEVAEIDVDVANIKKEYVAKTDELVKRIKRITSGCTLAKTTLGELWKQVKQLDDDPAAPAPKIQAE